MVPERLIWLGIRLAPLGERLTVAVSRSGRGPGWAWKAGSKELQEQLGLDEIRANRFVEYRRRADIRAEERALATLGIYVTCPAEPSYPKALRDLAHPPPLLFFRGSLFETPVPAVAVVGSRSATAYGRKVARELGRTLAGAGLTVVSGLARGVDAAAHDGALEAGGNTAAVLGCGLDTVYPPENRRLFERLSRAGALISEYPPGTPPLPRHFPARNRIVSGLCRAVVVVEAGRRSGALITAGHALDQGREVFVVPGSVYSPVTEGVHQLLKEGACPIRDGVELLEEMGVEARVTVPTLGDGRSGEQSSPAEENLLGHIPFDPVHIEELIAASRLPAHQVAGLLLALELQGRVLREAGQRYARVR